MKQEEKDNVIRLTRTTEYTGSIVNHIIEFEYQRNN